MAIAGVVSGIAAVGSVAGDLFSNDKDPERLAKNAGWYSDALGGDPDALLALKGMSGRYGTIPKGTPPGGSKYCACSGWATAKARDDAHAKYQAAVAALGGAAPPIMAPTGSIPTANKIADTLGQIGTLFTGAGQTIGGAATLTDAQQRAKAALGTFKAVFIVGGVALVGFLAWRAWRR